MRIRHLSTRFALLLAAAAVLPLLAFGVASLMSLQRGTRDSVVNGNVNVATRAAEEIRRYVTTNAELLKALAADLQDTGLEQWQQDRILKNYVLQVREFREITLFDEAGGTVATSRVAAPARRRPPASGGDARRRRHVVHAPGRRGAADGPLRRPPETPRPAGRLAGRGVQPGRNVADGRSDPYRGPRLRPGRRARRQAGRGRRSGQEGAGGPGARHDGSPAGPRGRTPPRSPWRSNTSRTAARELGVAARIASLGWTVIVEQPTSEAYANATRLQRLLVAVDRAGAARDDRRSGISSGRSFISADPHAADRDARGRRRPARHARAASIAPTSSPTSARTSTRWRTASSSCRRT